MSFFKDGEKLSFSRLTGFLLVISYLAGFFYLLFTQKVLSDIPFNLLILIVGLYGLNKIGVALCQRK